MPDHEVPYLNSLLYLEPGSIVTVLGDEHVPELRHLVKERDAVHRRVTMRDGAVYGYCRDGLWRRLRSTAEGTWQLDRSSDDRVLEITTSIHSRLPVQFVTRAKWPAPRVPPGKPVLLDAPTPEAQIELDQKARSRVERDEAELRLLNLKQATDQAAWLQLQQPNTIPVQWDEDAVTQRVRAELAREKEPEEITIGSGDPGFSSSAAVAAGRYRNAE